MGLSENDRNFINYITTFYPDVWNHELYVNEIFNKFNNKNLDSSIKKNAIEYLRTNSFIELKPNHLFVYEFTSIKGRELHLARSIDEYLKREKENEEKRKAVIYQTFGNQSPMFVNSSGNTVTSGGNAKNTLPQKEAKSIFGTLKDIWNLIKGLFSILVISCTAIALQSHKIVPNKVYSAPEGKGFSSSPDNIKK